jgi:uncharacterized protein (TIGR03435 family)
MKKLILGIIAVTIMFCGVMFAQAQDITGNWQGTVKANTDLRTVIKITKVDGGKLAVMFYSIDQSGRGLGASAVDVKGSSVKFSFAAMDGTYEGTLSGDGKSITGNFTQGGRSTPLNLVRVSAEAAWAIPEPPAPVPPMAADANPVFEVATIKPSDPDRPGKAFLVQGRQFSTLNTSLSDMITFAYGLHPRQLVGAPDWVEKDKYDVVGKPDGVGQPNLKQWKTMFQKLLVERFHLTFHNDKKELSVYALTVGKNGPKMAKSQADPNGVPGLFFRGLGVLPAQNATMADFAGVMQSAVLDKPVVDQTGIAGRYDFTLTWTPDESQFGGLGARVPPPADNVAAPPDLYTAIQEQLGLKLVSTKAPVDVLVIDHVEKPSSN